MLLPAVLASFNLKSEISKSIFLCFFLVAVLGSHWAKNGRRRQDLVEVLELLTSSLLITVTDSAVIDLLNVGETIDYEST